jgi:small subunit ribosomal protein S15
MSITKDQKSELINKFGGKATNTGSSQVQVALLTERISQLTEHLKAHPKDFHSRRGLLMMVSRRQKLLKYLSASDIESYRTLTGQLNIRQKH